MSLLNLNHRDNFLGAIDQEFNRVFDQFFSQGPNSVKSRSGYPKLDVFETDSVYQVEICVPGIDPNTDLKVELIPADISNGSNSNLRMLRVSGKMNAKYQVPDKAVFIKKEMSRQKFVREWLLPENVIGDPKAEYEYGMLQLSWSKEPVLTIVEPKVIPVKIAKA